MSIVELPSRCWFVATADGEPLDTMGEGYPHYLTEAEARQAVNDLSEAYEGLAAGLLPHACIEVTCNGGCPEARFEDDDTYGIVHFPDVDTALSMLRADGWVIGFNNAAWHSHCAPEVAVMTCAWCGRQGPLVATHPDWGAPADQPPIAVCPDREPCRRRAETNTRHALTGASK